MAESRITVRIRPAATGDTPQVMELLSHIWEGQDYVPALWDKWLQDPEGRLVVAEYQERIAGLGRLARLSPDEWWLQGLRVHPDFEGRGVASQLHDYLVNDWRINFGGTLRLSTASTRYSVHHLCERTGFQKVAEISVFRAPAEPPDSLVPLPFQPLDPQDAPVGLAFIQNSPLFELQLGLWSLGWEWLRPTLNLLQEAVQRRHAWWWRNRQGLLVILLDEEDEIPVPFIQHLSCPLEDLVACLQDYRRLAGHLGYALAAWEVPLLPSLLDALAQAGFQRTWDGAIFLYAQNSAASPLQTAGTA
jgi:GNAT superfamily N-acetyltransferase